jgi:hypothetical protein
VIGDFNGWRRDAHPAGARRRGDLGRGTSPGPSPAPLQVPASAGAAPPGTRPTRTPTTWSRPPAGGAGRPGWQRRDEPRLRLGRLGLDGAAEGARLAGPAGLRLRGPPRLLAAQAARREPLLPRDRRAAGGPRPAPRVHPRRAAPRDGAPVLRLVGVPGRRVLRADVPLREPAGPDAPRGHPPPARDRGPPRLGARPLRPGPPGPLELRRHPPLRAHRPPHAHAPGLGDVRVRLREAGRPELPPLQRPLLARPLPPRRPPRGRRRQHALPRLLPHGVDPERLRRAREPRGHPTSSSASTRRSTPTTRR